MTTPYRYDPSDEWNDAMTFGYGLTCAEVADRLRVKPREVEALARRGELPCVWWGDRPLFEEPEIERWLEDQTYRKQTHINPLIPLAPLARRVPAQRADGRWSVKAMCPDGVERRFVSSTREPIKPEFRQQSKRGIMSAHTRWTVLHQSGFTCCYCGRKAPEVRLEIEHLVSVVDGGTDDPANLAVACQDCNRGKGRRSFRDAVET